MNARIPVLCTFLCLFALLAAACSPDGTALPTATRVAANLPTAAPSVTRPIPQPATTAPPRSPIKLTILHTNDSRGYVYPCG